MWPLSVPAVRLNQFDLSLPQLLKDTAFLDLNSPMTPYEWFKVVFLFPWAALKLVVTLLCLVIVWGWVRVSLPVVLQRKGCGAPHRFLQGVQTVAPALVGP